MGLRVGRNMVVGLILLIVAGLSACSEQNEAGMADPGVLIEQARGLVDAGQFEAATQKIKQAVEIDGDNADAYYLIGKIAFNRKNQSAAARAFERALALAPTHYEARLGLAEIFMANAQYDQSRVHITRLLQDYPDDYKGAILSAREHLAQERPAEAEAVLSVLRKSDAAGKEVFLLMASARAKQGHFVEAEEILKAGISEYPDDASLRLVLVQLYSETDRPEEIEAELKTIIESAPEDGRYTLMLAKHYWTQDEKDAADALLKALINENPENTAFRVAAAEFYLKQKEIEKSRTILVQAVADLPDQPAVYLALNRFYQVTRQGDKGIETLLTYLGEAQGKTPDELSPVYLALAQSYFQRREMDKAGKYIEKILSKNPDHLDAVFLKGRIEMAVGKTNLAVSAFKAVVSKRPDLEEGYLHLAQAYLFDKAPDAAVSILQKGMDEIKASKRMHLALAGALKAQKDYKGTEAALLKALEMDPKDVKVQAALGDFYTEIKNYGQAQREYSEIIAKFPESPIGYLRLARLYFAWQQPENGVLELERGYQNNNSSAELLTELVSAYLHQDQAEKAILLCNARLAKDPKEAFSHHLLGKVYLHTQKIKPAQTALEKAVALAPSWPEASNSLAALFILEKKKEKAKETLMAALGRNPDNAAAYLMLGRLHEAEKQYGKAAAIYEQGLETIPEFWAAAKNLSLILCHQNAGPADLDRALQLASAAYLLQPGRVDVIDTLAWVHFKKGDNEKALALFDKIGEQAAKNPILAFHQSMALLDAGKPADALARLEPALKDKRDFIGRADAEAVLKELKARG